MWFIIKKEFLWFLKNPVYYLGALLMFIIIYSSISGYLDIHYFDEDEDILEISQNKMGDADINHGYIPSTNTEKFYRGLSILGQTLRDVLEINEDEVQQVIHKIQAEDMSVEQIKVFVESKYPIEDVQSYFLSANDVKKGTPDEVNQYIKERLEKENYSEYFGRKYSDYLGLAIVIYSVILLVFLYIYDYKKDLYELLHTKPLKSWKYILGKTLGGVLPICFIVFIITAIFDAIIVIKANSLGYPVNLFDIWFFVITLNLPAIFYISLVYVFFANIFKTPLPGIPLLLLQLLYSNLGTTDKLRQYGYKHRLLSIIVRFPDKFFETNLDGMSYLNQAIMIIIAILFACISIYQWNRRRLL
jgi:ABC-2 type transport system permease protein